MPGRNASRYAEQNGTAYLYRMRVLFPIFLFLITAFHPPEPWTKAQLMEPDDLAKMMHDPRVTQPLIYCVGPQAVIRNSIDVGPGQEEASIGKLEDAVAKQPKGKLIVLYCGCCPIAKCPNVRPAFRKLTDLGFHNHKLLNLPTTVKADWMDKGYPVNPQ